VRRGGGNPEFSKTFVAKFFDDSKKKNCLTGLEKFWEVFQKLKFLTHLVPVGGH
jgi:hypothetical protein